MQNLVMEDVDRIEVIRGRGGALWGANAVNGVINIITKDAAETQGGLVSGAAGTTEQPDVSARYGGAIGAGVCALTPALPPFILNGRRPFDCRSRSQVPAVRDSGCHR